jgi:hypothetical protein
MSNTNLSRHAWFAAGLAVVCLMGATPVVAAPQSAAARPPATQPAAAQPPRGDDTNRWQPWLGCWSATPPRFADLEAEPQQVCVVPVANTLAVDVVTITGSKIVSRERIDPNGEHRPGEREGCAGWDSALWSADMRRVYLQSEYTCTGGVKRATTGLMASAANGDWLDIVGVGLRDKVGVRVLRHRPSPPLPTLPPEIASAVARDPREPAALKVLLPVGDAEIIDASKYVSGAVIEAWLAENRQKFTMNGKRLAALANAGVEDRVLDMLVALSYPEVFAIKPSPTMTGELAIGGGGGGGNVFLEASPFLVGGSIFDACNPYYTGLSLYGWDGCSPYGFYGYGYGSPPFGYYGGGWYEAGGGGGIIVVPTPPSPSTGHGQVVNGKGYVSGDSGGSSASSSSGGGSSSGSSGSSGGSSGGGFSGSSGGDRTAVPR